MRFSTGVAIALVATLSSANTLLAQQIRGRVVDEPSRQGLTDVTVTLIGPDSAVLQRVGTDQAGFFLLKALSAGQFDIVVERIGYAKERRTVTFESADITIPAFVLRSEAIPLAPLEAVVIGNPRNDAAVGFKRSRHVLSGGRMRMLEQNGLRFIAAIRDVGAGLQVKETYPRGVYTLCIESSRKMPSFNPRTDTCNWIAVIVDGIEVEDPTKLLRGFSLQEIESLEYLTPVEAGHRYGLKASANGALVIWSRGRGPHRDPARDRKQ